MKRNFLYILSVCLAFFGCISLDAFPPFPIRFAKGCQRDPRRAKTPTGPAREWDERSWKSLPIFSRKRILSGLGRHRKNLLEEDALLRKFIVHPKPDGDRFEQVAEFIYAAEEPIFSVEHYRKSLAEGDAIRAQMAAAFAEDPRLKKKKPIGLYPVSPKYLLLDDTLKAKAKEYRDLLFGCIPCGSKLIGDPFNNAAIIILMPAYGIVLKMSNPYTSFPQHYEHRAQGFGGACKNLRRQVHRVSAAAQINEECAETGVRAPLKRLCLRPGADISGSINDATTIVIAEYIERRLELEPTQDYLDAHVCDEMVEGFMAAAGIAHTTDFHCDNVWFGFDADESLQALLIDTEAMSAYPVYDLTEAAEALPFEHPRKTEYLLAAPLQDCDIEWFLYFRVKALSSLVPESEAPLNSAKYWSECMCVWLTEYLKFMVSRGDLTQPQADLIQEFWMGAPGSTCFMGPLEEMVRRRASEDGFHVKMDALLPPR